MKKTTTKKTPAKTKKAKRGIVLPNGKSPQEVLDAAAKGETIVITFPNAGEAWRRAYTFWSLRRTRGLVETVGVSFDREKAAVTVGPKAKVSARRGASTAKPTSKKKPAAKRSVVKVASIDGTKSQRRLAARLRSARRTAA